MKKQDGKEKKVVVGLRQMKTKDRWGRRQTIIKIKQTQKWQINKKPKRTPNAKQKFEVSKNIKYFGCKKISELKHEPKNNP